MSLKRILIVEDDHRIAQNIQKGLIEKGFEAEVAYDGEIGKRLALHRDFDLILLDLNLPFINGYVLCEEIKKNKPGLPVIITTALGETEDKIEGFEKGADDYLVKPYDFRELLARINVLLKRNLVSDNQNINEVKINNLEVNLEQKTARREGISIDLTPKEFSLLEYFIKNKNRVISKNELSENIWDQKNQQSLNLIEVYINFLRKKIDKDFEPKLIHTKSGMGYILKDE